MNKLVFKLTTAVSTAALLTGSVASVAFGTTTVTVTGNGADSNNTANVNVSTSKNIFQTNTADIQNTVNVTANSGNNTANKNTGGDTSIKTGDANVSSSVSNSANSNVAQVDCGCTAGAEVKISGNGEGSDNTANVKVAKSTKVVQANTADVTNNVRIDANSGKNSAEKNTGGNTSISTGDLAVTSSVKNDVNQNVAKIGGGNGGGALSAEISGNGSGSDNDLNLNVGNDVQVFQNNVANIDNNVDVKANSGKNTTNKNTGGDTSIDTGDANVAVSVTNRANSNALDLSTCDCGLSGSVKIAGNGADSNNDANVTLGSALLATQTNDFDCGGSYRGWIFDWNENSKGDCAGVNVNSNTGDNKANENTVHGDDPMTKTGDAGSDVRVNTQANSNVLGSTSGISIPGLPNVQDLNGLLVLLMGMFHSS